LPISTGALTAILVAQTTDLETASRCDAAMFEKYGFAVQQGQNRDERRRGLRDAANMLLLFRRTIAALKQAQETEDGVRGRSRVRRAAR
jgi:hypothetical protein